MTGVRASLLRRMVMGVAAVAVLAAAWFGPEFFVRGRTETLEATLSGFEEVPPILTPGTGTFRATLAGDGQSLRFQLTFADLLAPVTVAHLHFGQPGVNGGVFAFLCGGGGRPACPERGGTVEGTLTANDILAVSEQGLEAGDWAGAVRILRAGMAYANVHSTRFPAGEIRGQVRR
ncbi:MAG TPA: CHRD domain-containing protein [Limnochordales bacterium]